MGDEDSTAGLLIVLVDLNFSWWAEQVVAFNQAKVNQAKPQGRSHAGVSFEAALQHFENLSADSPECQGINVAIWSNICAFLNGYLSAKSSNQVAVIGCYGSRSQFLYCLDFEHGVGGASSVLTSVAGDLKYSSAIIKPEMLGNSSKPETFNYMNVCIRENLKRLSATLTPQEIESGQQTSLAGALGKALCYSRRVTQQQRLQQQQAGTAVKKTAGGHVLASATATSASRVKRSTRILAISCGRETQNQYLHFINAVFTAQKMGIVIDALVLDNENDSIMLQQAADLTSGRYHKISHLRDTLSVLFAAFLIEPSIRDKVYVFRRFTPIDYRAACFCHHKLIDTGYVCSVCLSVFCTFRPICSTCRVRFDLWKNLKPSQMTPTKKLPSSAEEKQQHTEPAQAAMPNGDGIPNGVKKIKR